MCMCKVVVEITYGGMFYIEFWEEVGCKLFCSMFMISPIDIRERFHMVVLLAVMSVRNLAAFNWDPGKSLIHRMYMYFINSALLEPKGGYEEYLNYV